MKGFLTHYVKGVLIGLTVSLACILVFAFVLKFVAVGDVGIKTVNQIIKMLSVVLACLAAVREDKGIVKGALIGLSVIAFTYLLFGAISCSISFGLGTAIELAFGLVTGAISGILAVNCKKSAKG